MEGVWVPVLTALIGGVFAVIVNNMVRGTQKEIEEAKVQASENATVLGAYTSLVEDVQHERADARTERDRYRAERDEAKRHAAELEARIADLETRLRQRKGKE